MSPSNLKSIYPIAPGRGGLPRLDLAAPDGARLQIYPYGAHITSWVPVVGGEQLFLSRLSQFHPGAPIRGGIPVVFPQFGSFGPLPMHGLARLMTWTLSGVQQQGERLSAAFHLRDTQESLRLWPHAFQAELVASVGGKQMEVSLGVTNTGSEPFDFTAGFHTYLGVSSLADTCLAGLDGLRYTDAADGWAEKQQVTPQVGFTGEVNRIYYAAPAGLRLVEPGRSRVVRQSGFADSVVWNPGAARCAGMPDLEPDDYRRFVCIEAAAIGLPVHLAPGERWQGQQGLVIE